MDTVCLKTWGFASDGCVVKRGPRLSTHAAAVTTSADLCNGRQPIWCSTCCKLALMEHDGLQAPLSAWAGSWQVGTSQLELISFPKPGAECKMRAARIAIVMSVLGC